MAKLHLRKWLTLAQSPRLIFSYLELITHHTRAGAIRSETTLVRPGGRLHGVSMAQPVRVLPRERCGDIALLNAALDRLESLPVVDGPLCFKEQHNTQQQVVAMLAVENITSLQSTSPGVA